MIDLHATALAALAVGGGANIASGQTVIVSARLGQAALAREIAAACYDRGAHHVQVDYTDPWVSRARFQRAPEEALGTVIPWVRERPRQMAEMQAAWIGLSGPPEPGVLDDVDPARIGRDTPALVEWAEVIDRCQISWTIIPGPTEAWARLVYGDAESAPLAALWRDLADVCRLDEPDPAGAWRQRSAELRQACERLEAAGLDALRFRGPGTDLTVGLLDRIHWHGGGMRTAWGRDHLPNLPTEEVFTSPDPERPEGMVTSTKPLLVSGRVVSGLRIHFEHDRAVQIDADEGALVLRELVRRDVQRAGRGGPSRRQRAGGAYGPGVPRHAARRERRQSHRARLGFRPPRAGGSPGGGRAGELQRRAHRFHDRRARRRRHWHHPRRSRDPGPDQGRVGSVAVRRRRALLTVAVAVAAASLTLDGHAGAAQPRPKRKPTPVASFTLQWVGDMALSTERGLPPGGFLGSVHAMRGNLTGADLTVGNLEGTLSVGGPSKCGAGPGGGTCFAFQAPPAYGVQLHAAGFDLVNQANNHSMDYGESGRTQTLDALRGAGVRQTGLPGEITTVQVKKAKVAFVGFAPYSFDADLLDIPAAQALIRRARRRARVVVVLIHAGAEGADRDHTPYGTERYLGEDRGDPRAFAHAAIDAGASLVLGSGPHVIRGVERYRGHPIAYSLGNFVGYHTLGGGGLLSESGIFRVMLSDRGTLLAARWISVHLYDGLPYPERSNAAARLMVSLSRQDFPARHFDTGPDGHFRL